MKNKTCLECNNPIWARGRCKYHDYFHNKNNPKVAKKYAPAEKLSGKRKEDEAKYQKLRVEYLNRFPHCEPHLTGCTQFSTTIHHKAGRTGPLIYDVKHFLACCMSCHSRIENNPDMAKEMGFSVSRLAKK